MVSDPLQKSNTCMFMLVLHIILLLPLVTKFHQTNSGKQYLPVAVTIFMLLKFRLPQEGI